MIAYRLLWLLAWPLVVLCTLLHHRLRGSWRERLGWSLPVWPPGAVLLHGSSMGEGVAASALAEGLRSLEDPPLCLRTAFTDTGLQAAREQGLATVLPWDAPWVVGRWLDALRPRAVVLLEGELWPGLCQACLQRGIPVAVVSAKAGRGARRLVGRPALFRPVREAVQLWLCIDEEACQFWSQAVSAPTERLGDLKREAPTPRPALSGLDGALIAGSTREGDEERLLEAWGQLSRRPPLVLAPRHPQRFGEVIQLLERGDWRWERRSQLSGSAIPEDLEILLLDSVGELAGLYSSAAAAFVGGTLSAEIGGHSPAEALAAGLPVLAGPHRHANAAAWERGRILTAPEEGTWLDALQALLELEPLPPPDPGRRHHAAQRLLPLLRGPIPPAPCPRPLLRPLVPLWRAWLRRRLRQPALSVSLPVISVGNLSAGGSGKSPVTRWIARRLQASGHRPVILARGHRRDRRGPALRACSLTPPTQPLPEGVGWRPWSESDEELGAWLGDELAEHASAGVPVVSGVDRVQAAALAEQLGADCVLLDDGLQYTRLRRDLNVVVLDTRWALEGGQLPAGNLREGPQALARADVLWVTGGELPRALREPLREDCLLVRAELRPQAWRRGGERLPLESLQGAVDAFAGIAHPQRFLESLLRLGLRPRRWLPFSDHHRFAPAELQLLRSLPGPLVTTGKDAARLDSSWDLWVLEGAWRFLQGEEVMTDRLRDILSAAQSPRR